MNALVEQFSLSQWKPVWAALALPPVPFLVVVMLAFACARTRRGLAAVLAGAAVAGLWLSSTSVVGDALAQALLRPMHVLGAADLARLRQQQQRGDGMAIVVLGSGLVAAPDRSAPAQLSARAFSRLRYGVELSRATGIALAYSGGVGNVDDGLGPEAQAAARTAQADFGVRLRWLEGASRDTRENANKTIALLRAQGLREIVLVTHDWHMRRAVRAFAQAARSADYAVLITPAPCELSTPAPQRLLAWLPSAEGFSKTRYALHEWLGWLLDA